MDVLHFLSILKIEVLIFQKPSSLLHHYIIRSLMMPLLSADLKCSWRANFSRFIFLVSADNMHPAGC